MTKSRHNHPVASGSKRATLLIIISGPSGVGKDAILSRMKESGYPLRYVTTVTTRPKRPTEREGVDYYFVSLERFQEMIRNCELLEWAKVYDNFYGVPKAPVKQGLEQGHDVIMRIDVQGAATIKKAAPEAVFIFIIPPTMAELQVRLKQRHTESDAALAIRLEAAAREMEQLPMFDYVVVNQQDKIDLAVDDIKAIISAEKCRVRPREVVL